VEKYGTAGQATDDNTIRRMSFASWITKARDTNSEYVILFAFLRQQRLRERASILRYTRVRTLPVWLFCTNFRFTIELWEKIMAITIGKLLTKRPVCKDKLKMKNICIKIMKNRLFLSCYKCYLCTWSGTAEHSSSVRYVAAKNEGGVRFLAGCEIVLHTATSLITWSSHPTPCHNTTLSKSS